MSVDPKTEMHQKVPYAKGLTTPTTNAVQPLASSCMSFALNAPDRYSTKSASSPSSVLLEPELLPRPSGSTPSSSMPSCSMGCALGAVRGFFKC